MNKLTSWFFAHTSLRLVIIMSVVYLIFPLVLLPGIINEGSTGPLDLHFFYTAETAYQIINAYSDSVRNRYIFGLLSVDLVYPVYYSFLLAFIIALLILKLPPQVLVNRHMIIVPFVMMLFDFWENTLLVFMLSNHGITYPGVATLAGVVTCIKWCAALLILVTIVAYLSRVIWARRHTVKVKEV